MAVSAPGPYDLEPVFTAEDVEIPVTLSGSGSIAAYTFRFQVWGPDGVSVVNETSAPGVEITDADGREVTARALGVTWAEGVHRWSVRRTNSGGRTVCAWGTFTVRSEQTAPLIGP